MPSTTLSQLITSDSLVREYFKVNASRKVEELALELLREAIGKRMELIPSKEREKHYHVAYIKHNRFLSPTQKQQVTEKVTQIIPITDQPLKIYAKPKPKIDEGLPLQPKSEQEIETREEIEEREATSPKIKQNSRQKVSDIPHPIENEESKHEESEKYLSPKGKLKTQANTKPTNNKIKQNTSPPNKQPSKQYYYSPKTKESSAQQHRLNIQSNCRQRVKQRGYELGSPNKIGKEDYGKVQSRIKFLIDRDKHSKKMERILQAQNHKIDKLEQRQERLLLLQYEQERQMLRTNQIQKYIDQSLSDSDSLSEESDTTPNNRLSAISQQLDAINERAEGIRDYQHALYANLERMKDKTYKISSSPVYPISSEEDDEVDSDCCH